MIQLRLDFITENNILPSDYSKFMVSFLKKSTEQYATGFYKQIFDKDNIHIKTYTFSTYLPGVKFSSKCIQLDENAFSIYFSDCNMKELMHFYNSFITMKNKKFPVKNNTIILNNISSLPIKDISTDEIIIKILSPLLVRSHFRNDNKDEYILYNDSIFNDKVKSNIKAMLDYEGLNFKLDNFRISEVDAKSVVVNTFSGTKIGNIGYFKLEGSKELLNLLQLSGIGSRRGEGFGKFEVVRW